MARAGIPSCHVLVSIATRAELGAFQHAHPSLTRLPNRVHQNRYADAFLPGAVNSLPWNFCDTDLAQNTFPLFFFPDASPLAWALNIDWPTALLESE